LKDDRSILLLEADRNGELDEVDVPPELLETKYMSAALYDDKQKVFDGPQSHPQHPIDTTSSCILALLSSDGGLSLYSASDLTTPLFHYDGVQFLPYLLSRDSPLPRHWKRGEALSELLIVDLGDSALTHPYLILRTNSNDFAIYEPFTPASMEAIASSPGIAFRKLNLRQISNPGSEEDSRAEDDTVSRQARPMRVAYLSGLFVVLVPGQSPAMIAKVATSSPRVYNFSSGPVFAFAGYHTPFCSQGFVYLDEQETLSISKLPSGLLLGNSNWIQRKIELGVDVSGIAYLERTYSYVLATSNLTDFQLPQDDEWHAEWRNEHATCLPQVEQGSVKLLSSATFNIIDSFQLDVAERTMCIKTMNLEVSEETHERKDLIVVGTAITKGEDIVARGAIYIFDVVDVVPQPGVPETDLKLKLIAKEEVKGAVTALSRIGSQGFLLAAQGQKCMVRGLKEDLSILPVAFMDMKYYVNVAKELAGTGLCILGDAMSELWFVGYSVSVSISSYTFANQSAGRTVQAATLWTRSNRAGSHGGRFPSRWQELVRHRR
jgi:cleavage and polyadenylation specificity factor subunit 1